MAGVSDHLLESGQPPGSGVWAAKLTEASLDEPPVTRTGVEADRTFVAPG